MKKVFRNLLFLPIEIYLAKRRGDYQGTKTSLSLSKTIL